MKIHVCTQLVYASTARGKRDLDIWLETLPAAHRLRLTTNPADDYNPSLAQGLVAFRSNRQAMVSGRLIRGGIYTVSTHGGEEKLIAPEGYGPQLSPDGRWLAYWTGDPVGDRSELYLVASHGGLSERICAHCYSARHQVWSSDGRALLFWGDLEGANGQTTDTDWWVVPINNGSVAAPQRTMALAELRRIGIQGSMIPEAWQHDQLFFSVHGPTPGLWKVPLKGSLFGKDRFYYSVVKSRTNVWELPVSSGKENIAAMAQPVTFDDANDGFPSLSKDGSRLVFTSNRGGNRAIWLQDFKGDQERLVANSDSLCDAPKLSPDGAPQTIRPGVTWRDTGRRMAEPSIFCPIVTAIGVYGRNGST